MWIKTLMLKPSDWQVGDFLIIPGRFFYNGQVKTYKVTFTDRKDNQVWVYSHDGVLQMFDKYQDRQWMIVRQIG